MTGISKPKTRILGRRVVRNLTAKVVDHHAKVARIPRILRQYSRVVNNRVLTVAPDLGSRQVIDSLDLELVVQDHKTVGVPLPLLVLLVPFVVYMVHQCQSVHALVLFGAKRCTLDHRVILRLIVDFLQSERSPSMRSSGFNFVISYLSANAPSRHKAATSRIRSFMPASMVAAPMYRKSEGCIPFYHGPPVGGLSFGLEFWP